MITITSLASQLFSSDIPDLDIAVDGTRASVTITIDTEQVYSEVLYPISGKITLTELSDLVNPYAREKLVVDLTVKCVEQNVTTDSNGAEVVTDANTATTASSIVYCTASINIDCATFCSYHFLSVLLGTKITANGRLEYLHYLGTDDASILAVYTDETTATFVGTKVQGNDKYTTIDVSPSRFATTGKALAYYTVTAGSREQLFQIDFMNPDCAPILLFSNTFGCQELMYCTGKHQVAPEYTRSSAYIKGLYKNYNIEEKREFKADTGCMNTAMADWIDDLFRSHEIFIVNFYNSVPTVGREVTVTESKSEHSNMDDELTRYTFTYRYASRQQHVVDMKRLGRIFDNTFDNTFN